MISGSFRGQVGALGEVAGPPESHAPMTQAVPASPNVRLWAAKNA